MSDYDFTGRPLNSETLNQLSQTQVTKLKWKNLDPHDVNVLFTFNTQFRLQTLNINRDVCDSEQFSLSQLVEPTKISFVPSTLTSLFAAAVFRLTKHTSLRTLLEPFPHLTELSLACSGINDVRPLITIQTLVLLNLENNYIDDHGAYLLSRTSLKQLNISRNDITDRGLQHFFENKTLTDLVAVNQRIHYISPNTLEALEIVTKRHRKQKKPKYANVQKYDEENAILFVNNSEIFHKDIPKLYPNTVHLQLQGDFKSVSPIYKFKHLQSLQFLQITRLPHDAFQHTGITELSIDYSDNLVDLDKLENATNVHTLQLYNTPLTDTLFKQILQLPNLLFLNIYGDAQPKLTRAIVPLLLKNESLISLNIVNFDWADSKKYVDRHIGLNKSRRLKLVKSLPLLAGLQLGGSMKNAIVDLLPMVYDYLEKDVMFDTIEHYPAPTPAVISRLVQTPVPKLFS